MTSNEVNIKFDSSYSNSENTVTLLGRSLTLGQACGIIGVALYGPDIPLEDSGIWLYIYILYAYYAYSLFLYILCISCISWLFFSICRSQWLYGHIQICSLLCPVWWGPGRNLVLQQWTCSQGLYTWCFGFRLRAFFENSIKKICRNMQENMKINMLEYAEICRNMQNMSVTYHSIFCIFCI